MKSSFNVDSSQNQDLKVLFKQALEKENYFEIKKHLTTIKAIEILRETLLDMDPNKLSDILKANCFYMNHNLDPDKLQMRINNYFSSKSAQ